MVAGSNKTALLITIKEIAQQAGFSPSTVSRLLSNDPSLSVSPETKQKILNTALSLGYERKYIKTIIEKIALLFWITEIEELEDIYFKDIRSFLKQKSIFGYQFFIYEKTKIEPKFGFTFFSIHKAIAIEELLKSKINKLNFRT